METQPQPKQKAPKGGYRERAGRPRADYVAIKVAHRRCRRCGRFAPLVGGHKCGKPKEKSA